MIFLSCRWLEDKIQFLFIFYNSGDRYKIVDAEEAEFIIS